MDNRRLVYRREIEMRSCIAGKFLGNRDHVSLLRRYCAGASGGLCIAAVR